MFLGGWPERVDDKAGRWVAGTVALGLATAFLTGTPLLSAPFAVGFVLRAVLGPRSSPLARLAAAIARRLGPPRPVASIPKRFAQGIGAAIAVGAAAAHLAGATGVGWALALVLAGCAGLEASTGVCIGCLMYRQLQRIGLAPATICPTCITDSAEAAPGR